MTPDERQLLSGLFDRIRTAGSQPRDRDAESLISDAVKQQPYAPYLLSQTVIVQEQALRAANDRLQELEAKVKTLESGQPQGEAAGEGGFLGGLGRSIFGSGTAPQQNRGYAPPPNYAPPSQSGQSGPWGQSGRGGGWNQEPQAAPQGGGFLKGALGMAAGVAGGALLANSISGLFHGGNNPFGIGSGMGGGFGGGFPGGGGGETIVNNYYGDENASDPGGYDQSGGDQGGLDSAADYGDDGGFGGGDDGNYDV